MITAPAVTDDLREALRHASPAKRRRAVAALPASLALALLYDWRGLWARPSQLPPDGDWVYWFVMAGRGFGKTRTGAEWTHDAAHRYERISLLAPTLDDVREIMVEGESGLLATAPPWWRPTWIANRRLVIWPNGCRATYYTADEPERLRGKQHQAAWLEEPGSWRYPEAWDQFRYGFRLPPDPRCVVTGTPRANRIVRELLTEPTCVVTTGTTYENLANLAAPYRSIIRRFEGTRMGEQELLARLIEDDEEAIILLSWLLNRCQGAAAPKGEPRPTVLGVDVASTGADRSVIAAASGPLVEVLYADNEPDTMRFAERVEAEATRLGATLINVDVIGVGQGVYDELRRRKRRGSLRAKVNGVNVAAQASDPRRFVNIRSELWWRGRELSETGGWDLSALDGDALDELAAPHFREPRGRVQVEPKDDVKKRLGRSPDVADGVLLAAAGDAVGGGRVVSW